MERITFSQIQEIVELKNQISMAMRICFNHMDILNDLNTKVNELNACIHRIIIMNNTTNSDVISVHDYNSNIPNKK